jgi:hypothetical protein
MHKRFFGTQLGTLVHSTENLLPWHRWYIIQYENLLRLADCTVTVPYWDWSVVSGRPWGTTSRDLWYGGNSGFGGNGNPLGSCVQTGPFREGVWQLVPSVRRSRCLTRNFNGKPSDSAAIAAVLDTPPSRLGSFLGSMEGIHATGHCLIGGIMCTRDSASAPEFFLYHSYFDKVNNIPPLHKIPITGGQN